MRVTITTAYHSHPRTGAGKIRAYTGGVSGAETRAAHNPMQRTIGYPHEMTRDAGRWHAAKILAEAYEIKNDCQLALTHRGNGIGEGSFEFEVFDHTVRLGTFDEQRAARIARGDA